MQEYSFWALTAAASAPPLAATVMAILIHKHNRQMRKQITEMRLLKMQMAEMIAAPERLRQAAKQIRDSIARVQGEDIQ